MFRVTINDFASYKIDNFIMSYFRVSLDLLTDCWIEEASTMKDKIYIELNKNLSLPTVLPKKKPKNNYLTTVVVLKGWNLFVYYSEDKEQKIRFVEDIKFKRR